MNVDSSNNENTSMSDSAVSYNPEFSWESAVLNPTTSSSDDLFSSAEMSLVPPVAVSFGIDLSSQRRTPGISDLFHSSSSSSHEISSLPSTLMETTLGETARGSGTNESPRTSTDRIFGLYDDDGSLPNTEEPSGSERNTMHETIRILAANSDIENDDNNEFNDIHRPSSSTQESSRLRNSDNPDNLFAPEDSSSSSEASQSDVQNPFTLLRSPSNYFNISRNQGPSSLREDRPFPRLASRYGRASPFCFGVGSDNTNLRDQSLYPSYFASTRRLSPFISRIRRSFKRNNHTELASRNRVRGPFNVASTSNEDHSSYPEDNETRRTPCRRSYVGPKLFGELIPRHTHGSSEAGSSSRPNTVHDRLSGLRNPRLIQSIIEWRNSLRQIQLRERASGTSRARSMSPTPGNSWYSSDRPEDSPVHHIGRRFVSGNMEEQRRADSPPTILVSDEECPLIPTTHQVDISSSKSCTEQTASTCQQSKNSSAVVESETKKVPRTYDDLNNELTQLLECPICFEYSTPPINQCLQGHVICNNCRQKVNLCPTCRTVFQESRNLLMEKVAALLRYPCKNAMTGCSENLYLLEKERHEMSCGFRQYLCFISPCKWRGYKPELLVHVQEGHESHVLHGSSVNLSLPINGQTKKMWLMSAFNELFCVFFFGTLGVLKGCVSYIGDPSKCDHYTYNVSVTSEEEMLRTFNYSRITHVYDESFENIDMIDSVDLFSISHAQLRLFRKGTKASIRVSVEEVAAKVRPGFSGASTPSNL